MADLPALDRPCLYRETRSHETVFFTLHFTRLAINLSSHSPDRSHVRLVCVRVLLFSCFCAQSSARPVTLSPWRHTVNRLAADWDKEDEVKLRDVDETHMIAMAGLVLCSFWYARVGMLARVRGWHFAALFSL